MGATELERLEQAEAAGNVATDEALPALLGLLGDESWRVRAAAVQSLTRLRPASRVADGLIESLRDPEDTGRRNAALTALSQLGADALPGLLRNLADESPDQRKLAADALGLLGDPNAVPPLVVRLQDVDANVRAAVAEALGRIGSADAVGALRSHLLDAQPADPLEASTVLWALARARQSLPLDALHGWLKSPMTRAAALSLTAHCAEPEASTVILQALCSPLPTLRIAAIRALMHAGVQAPVTGALLGAEDDRRQVYRAALDLIDHRDEEVAAGAATVASWAAEPDTAAHLLTHRHGRPWDAAIADAWGRHRGAASREVATALERMEPEDQALALDLLVLHPHAECAAPLVERAMHAHGESLELLVRALLACDAVGAIPRLVARLLDASLEPEDCAAVERELFALARAHRTAIKNAIPEAALSQPEGARLWSAAAEPGDQDTLRDLLRNPNAAVRAAACDGLGRAGQEADAEALLPMLLDENPRVRAAAAASLGRVGSAAHVDLLEARANDEDLGVVSAALGALCQLSPARAREVVLGKAAHARADVVAAALRAAETLGGNTALAAGVRSLATGDVNVARAGVRALAASGSTEALSLVLPLLSDERWEVRHAAAQGLSRLWVDMRPDAATLGKVRQALASEQDALVREALDAALEQVAG